MLYTVGFVLKLAAAYARRALSHVDLSVAKSSILASLPDGLTESDLGVTEVSDTLEVELYLSDHQEKSWLWGVINTISEPSFIAGVADGIGVSVTLETAPFLVSKSVAEAPPSPPPPPERPEIDSEVDNQGVEQPTGGVNAGLVIGLVVFIILAILAMIVGCYYWRKQKREKELAVLYPDLAATKSVLGDPEAAAAAAAEEEPETFAYLCRLRHDTKGKFNVRLEAQVEDDVLEIFISNVLPSDVADDRGRIEVGDIVRSINGRDVEGMVLKDVKVLLIGGGANMVDLVLERQAENKFVSEAPISEKPSRVSAAKKSAASISKLASTSAASMKGSISSAKTRIKSLRGPGTKTSSTVDMDAIDMESARCSSTAIDEGGNAQSNLRRI